MKQLKVFYWNPNGKNDIEVVENGVVVDCMQEALFGYRVDGDYQTVPVKSVLTRIAVSSVSDGSDAIRFLKKHFPSLK